ncbi:MAG: helix-turn-helix domain-containing protein [Actinomycetota bacterium]
MGLRERNRRAAMRETQRIALRRFREDGFDAVRVEEIAEEAGMAASTVYRHFGTKEQLALWDEHDTAIDAALDRRLGTQPPLTAIRDALLESLAERYQGDLEFELDRVRYIYATEQLHAAAVEADFRDREELTTALRSRLPKRDREAAPILAGAALLALDVAMDRWQSAGGTTPLTDCITEAFATLERLGSIG